MNSKQGKIVVIVFVVILFMIILGQMKSKTLSNTSPTPIIERYYVEADSLKGFLTKLDNKKIYGNNDYNFVINKLEKAKECLYIKLHGNSNKSQFTNLYRELDSLETELKKIKFKIFVEERNLDWYSNELISSKETVRIGTIDSDNSITTYVVNPKHRRAKKLYDKYKWTKEDCLTVSQGKINIGMTKEMVRVAWGNPEDINTTTTSYGTSAQWCYSNSYVYFDEDIVTTIQN